MQGLNLRRMEEQAWKAAHCDGLTDVLFGILFLSATLTAYLDRLAVSSAVRLATTIALPFAGVAFIFWMRKRFVTPRLGRAHFLPRRVRRTQRTGVFLGFCVAATITLVTLTALSGRLGIPSIGKVGDVHAWLIVAAVVLVPIAGLAISLNYARLFLHGGLLVLVEFLHIVVHLPSRVPYGAVMAYGAASCVSLSIGITVFVRLVRSVPRAGAPDPERLPSGGVDDEA